MGKSLIWTKPFVLFLVMATFYFMNNYMLNPILAGYTTDLGGTGNVIGLVSGATSGVALFLTPFTGPLVDRYNRKLLSIASFSLLLVANTISFFAPTAGILLTARIIQGVGFAFSSVILSTAVSTMFGNEIVGKAIGIYAAVQALAQVVAPSVGLVIRDLSGYRMAYFVAMAFTAICLVLSLTASNFGRKPERAAGAKLSLGSIITVSGVPIALTSVVAGFLLHLVQSYVDPFTAITGHTAGTSLFFTVYAVTLLVSRFLFSSLMDKRSLGWFVVFCTPLSALAFYLIQVQTSRWLFWTGAVLCAVGLGTLQIMAQVSLVKSVPGERRGVANSTYYIAMNLGHTLGGYLGGVWITGARAHLFFYYAAALSFVPLVFAVVFRRRYFRSPEKAAVPQ